MKRRKKHKRKSRKPIIAIIAVALFFLCLLSYSFLHSPSQTNINQGFSYKAAIVDHLSLTAPNPNFNQTSTNILKKAGFTVDYYPGEEVTVRFYRNLPKHGYGLIVLRVHSIATPPPLSLFTSELYSKRKYVVEQLTDRIVPVAYTPEEAEKGIGYFGIFPKFVQQDMKGTLQNTIIIMMGCEGLTDTTMAEAFVEKGAKVYVSWNGPISASHTDQATTQLLKHLLTEKQTIKKAVTETMKEVGPDPEYGSILKYYPDSVNNYVIPNVTTNLILNVATVSGYDSQSSLRHVHCPKCGKITTFIKCLL